MKILVGIPTRGRACAPKLAKRFAEFADVLIVAADTDLPENSSYRLLNTKPGLALQRSIIMHVAIQDKYDVVVQSDDDLGFKPGVMEKFFETIHELMPLGVASVSSKPRQYEFWDGPCGSNKYYEITPRLFQCWAVSTEAVSKIGYLDLDTCEDIEYTMRLVKNNLVSAQISIKGMTHDHLVPRLKKDESAGGQSTVERMRLMDKAVATINARYDFAKISRKGESSQSIKWDWTKVKQHIPNLGLGYEDKRGIRA